MKEAMREEHARVVGGVMDAMAVLGVIICSTSRLKTKEFIDLVNNAAKALSAQGNTRADQVLRGVAARLESYGRDVWKMPPPR